MTDNTQSLERTHYELVGGEEGVRALVNRFYDHMDAVQEVIELRAMHAKRLDGSRNKLFLFLSGWLGGPDLYVEKYGHPMLRRRHLPFSIGTAERDQWMHCMKLALDDMPFDQGLKAELYQAFFNVADHMRNRTG